MKLEMIGRIQRLTLKTTNNIQGEKTLRFSHGGKVIMVPKDTSASMEELWIISIFFAFNIMSKLLSKLYYLFHELLSIIIFLW